MNKLNISFDKKKGITGTIIGAVILALCYLFFETNMGISFAVEQELYEGINLGSEFGGTHGLITYMRTDSVRLSDDFLKEAKCDMIQGYYFSKPIPITEFEKLAFGLVISGKRILPSESQSDFVFQPEDYLESQQDFTESNFPASVILRKKSSDDE